MSTVIFWLHYLSKYSFSFKRFTSSKTLKTYPRLLQSDPIIDPYYCNKITNLLTNNSTMADWERRVAEERARRDASIAKLEPKFDGLPTELPLSSQKLPSQFLTDREIEITERYTVPELLAALKARKVSVEEVTRAFLRRAVIAHQAASQPSTLSQPQTY